MATEFKYEVIKNFGELSEGRSGWRREVNLVSWNEGQPKIDIRDWAPDHEKMGKGVSLTSEEVAVLREILAEIDLDDI